LLAHGTLIVAVSESIRNLVRQGAGAATGIPGRRSTPLNPKRQFGEGFGVVVAELQPGLLRLWWEYHRDPVVDRLMASFRSGGDDRDGTQRLPLAFWPSPLVPQSGEGDRFLVAAFDVLRLDGVDGRTRWRCLGRPRHRFCDAARAASHRTQDGAVDRPLRLWTWAS